ncbi:MAG: cbb3-type cytochrome c oxidase N-terminal domain-containing protein, partial [Bacteroidota bacterium]
MKTHSFLPKLMLMMFFLSGGSLLAQAAEGTAPTNDSVVWFLMISTLVIAFACLVLTATIWVLVMKKKEIVAATEVEVAEKVEVEEKPSKFSWAVIKQKLTDAVPIEREADIDMGHDYDGIRELDNNLPPWWKIGFYISIAY